MKDTKTIRTVHAAGRPRRDVAARVHSVDLSPMKSSQAVSLVVSDRDTTALGPNSPLYNTPNCVTLPPAEARRATEREETVARPRWQTGWLFKRGKKNPKWVGRFRMDYIADDGRRRRRQVSTVLGLVSDIGRREAQRGLCERLAAINQGTHKPEVEISFERFVVERFEPNIYPTLRFSTVRNYRWLIRRYMLPFFGQMRLPEIGPADVQAFLSHVSRKIAPRTVLSLRHRLQKIFGKAKQWGYIVSNPVEGAQVPTLQDTRERLALTPQQALALLAELTEPYRTLVLLALLSGLRRGEFVRVALEASGFP